MPAYRKVQEDLRARLRNGRWTPGTMLPGRKALAAEYGVNLETVQRGIKELVDEGLLVVDSRRGTFVARDVEVSTVSVAASSNAEPVPAQKLASTPHAIIGIVSYVDIREERMIASVLNAKGVEAIEMGAADFGYVCRTVNQYDIENETVSEFADTVSQLAQTDVAGIVLMTGMRPLEPARVAAVMNAGKPVVLVSLQQDRWPLPTVSYDNRDAGQLAARHLIEQGCRDLVFFSAGMPKWAADRRTGAREAMLLAGMPIEKLRDWIDESVELAIAHEDQTVQLQGIAREFMSRNRVFDGVIAGNDEMAYALMTAAREKGLVAGRDFGIVGFDDLPLSCFRGLTSLKPPVEAMGREAIRLLSNVLGGYQYSQRVDLHSKLIVRESSFLKRQ